MSSEHFSDGSKQCSTLNNTDLLVYVEVIRQHDNGLRFVMCVAEIYYYLAEQRFSTNPNILSLHHPLAW